MSDRYGRRKTLAFTLFGTAIGQLATLAASSTAMLVAARLFCGAFAANGALLVAHCMDVAKSQSEQVFLYNVVDNGWKLAFIITPALLLMMNEHFATVQLTSWALFTTGKHPIAFQPTHVVCSWFGRALAVSISRACTEVITRQTAAIVHQRIARKLQSSGNSRLERAL